MAPSPESPPALYPVVVALDLETTGLDPRRDRIIEIGARVIRGGVAAEEFAELAACPKSLPRAVEQLTGITNAMLEGRRPLEDVLDDFLAFLPEGALCLAHNALFDRSFLLAATRDRFKHVVFDTVELARICYPLLASHSLGYLVEALALPPTEGDAHRALADARALGHLWEKLLERAREIPLPVIGEINYLLEDNRAHPYRDFFLRLAAELLPKRFGQNTSDLPRLYRDSPQTPPRDPEDESPERNYDPLDIDAVRDIFGARGALARAMAGNAPPPSEEGADDPPPMAYECRTGQIEMAAAVADAFNGGRHLVVEAGTGIGKSMAYLAPAVLWAVRNRAPVVVSTNTKNLQSQLFEKDLPLVRRALGVDFKAALLKGRRNYLCLRKLFFILRQARHELEADEKLRMLNVLPWSVWSETGDISENIVSGRPGFGALWSRLSTIGEECLARGCRHFRKCFLWRARALSQSADVVVANHSLVFADLNAKNPSLPPARQLVFDEAHNLEEAATAHLTYEVSHSRLFLVLHRLHRSGRRGATGLLSTAVAHLGGADCRADPELTAMALKFAEDAQRAVEACAETAGRFFDALAGLLPKSGESSARYEAERKRSLPWDPVDAARTELFEGAGRTLAAVDALADMVKDMADDDFPHRSDLLRDLQASSQWLREVTEDATFVLDGGHPDYVYWVERQSAKYGGARALAAPVAVGALLHDQLYVRRQSVVFCSATMTVKGKFDFLSRRLGIDRIAPERLRTLNAGSPFDYPNQCLLVAPVFLPEPGEAGRDYAKELAELLGEVYRVSDGRGLALFTSYDMLVKVADDLEERLAPDRIRVLAQGRSGSREGITATFRRGGRSVLLGTHSFWEGVDVVGDALSCLAIARLPFMVQTEPLVEARCERVEKEGGNAFMEYSLPSAVIRFRQGFGRLIRSRSDRGVAIIADRRAVAKRYGAMFLDSLPVRAKTFSDRGKFLEAIAAFLGPPDPSASK